MYKPDFFAFVQDRETYDRGTGQYGFVRDTATVIIGRRNMNVLPFRTQTGGLITPLRVGFCVTATFDNGADRPQGLVVAEAEQIDALQSTQGLQVVATDLEQRFGELTIGRRDYSPALVAASLACLQAYTNYEYINEL